MRFSLRWFIILICIATDVEAGTIVKFTFNPPNGIRFVETVRQTKTVSGGPGEPANVEVFDAQVAYSIVKTPGQYLVEVQALKPPNLKSSPSVEALQYAILDKKLTYVLDSAGRLQRVLGLKEALEAGGFYQTISTMLEMMGVKDLRTFIEQQWVARELFLAATVDTVETDRTYQIDAEMPGISGVGPVQSHNEIRAAYPVDCAGRGCAQLQIVSDSDDPRLIESINRIIYQAMAGFIEMVKPGSSEGGQNLPKFQTRNSRYTVRRTRWVYQETSLPFAETVTRTLSAEFRMADSDPREPARFEEKTQYSYTYR